MNRRMVMCLILALFALNAAALDSNDKIVYSSTAWSAKAFTIDHPLDPLNKVLRHYCVEGPVVQNMYSGSVTLDAKGETMVQLPPYFDALNTNPRYVLTPVGAAMPNLHVMQKIHDNRFWIAGGSPDGEVSWLIIAQRNDPACVADLKNRPVEQLKSELKPGQIPAENQAVNTTTVSQ